MKYFAVAASLIAVVAAQAMTINTPYVWFPLAFIQSLTLSPTI